MVIYLGFVYGYVVRRLVIIIIIIIIIIIQHCKLSLVAIPIIYVYNSLSQLN